MSTGRHLSSEELDLLELGGLSTAELTSAQAHLAGCPRCAAQREALARDAAHFRQFHAPGGSPLRRPSTRPRWWVLGLVTAAALVALVTLWMPARTAEPERYLAARGEPKLQVIVARGETQTLLRSGDLLQAGDRLRFQVDGAGASEVLILSRDGAGEWSVYAPFGGQVSVSLQPGMQVLPGAVELDPTPGTEQLVAIFSRRPLRAQEMISALRAQPQLPTTLPGAEAVQRVSFQKR